MRFIALTLLLLVAALAHAVTRPLFIDGFEERSSNANTQDDMLLFQFLAGGAADADIRTAGQADCTGNNAPHPGCGSGTAVGNIQHDEVSGTGHYSSQGAVLVDVASGEQAYYSYNYNAKCTGAQACGSYSNCDCCTGLGVGNCTGDLLPLNEQSMSAFFWLRPTTHPTSTNKRRFFEYTEADGLPGCGIADENAGTFRLYYNAALLGTASTAYATKTFSCESDKYAPCTAGTQATDCPSGSNTCGSNCSNTDGSDCYHAPLKFTQINDSGTVKCRASVRGNVIAELSTTKPPPITNITDFKLGAVDTTASAFQAWFDDFVLCKGEECEYGVVATLSPKVGTTTGNLTWNPSSGADHGKLVNDMSDPQDKYSISAGTQLVVKQSSQKEELWQTVQNSAECGGASDCNTVGGSCSSNVCTSAQTTPALDGDMSIAGIQVVAIGNTDADVGYRQTDLAPLICTAAGACTWAPAKTVTPVLNTSDHVWGVGLWTTTASGKLWSEGTNFQQIGVGLATTTGFLGLSSSTLQPDSAGVDTVLTSTEATTNHGTDTTLCVGQQTLRKCTDVFKFDLSSLPAGAVILTADLTLTFSGNGITAPNLLMKRIVRTGWTEGGATWNTYDGTNNWGTAGALNTTTDVTLTNMETVTSPVGNGAKTFTGTANGLIAQANTALQSVSGQMHFLIEPSQAGNGSATIASSDNATAGDRPKLVLTYTHPISGMELRLHATSVMAFAEKRIPVPQNIKDQNIGVQSCSVDNDCGSCGTQDCEGGKCVKDCVIASVSSGDSLNGADRSQQCNGGSLIGSGPSLRCSGTGTLCNTSSDCDAGEACVGACSGASYCSYDTTNASQPPGGCGLNDVICHVCEGRLTENAGYGWACANDGECPQTGGTCTTGTGYCKNAADSADIATPCCAGGNCSAGTCVGGAYDGTSCDSSCQGLGGNCFETATCVLSCPGGRCSSSPSHLCSQDADCRPPLCPTCGATETCKAGCSKSALTCTQDSDCRPSACPSCDADEVCYTLGQCPTARTAWGNYTVDGLDVDEHQVCHKDGLTSAGMATVYWDSVMRGEGGSICDFTVGSGRCTCASGADCGGGTCDTSHYATGRCTTNGTGAFASCTSSTQCTTGVCAGRPPDIGDFVLQANDQGLGGLARGNCPQCAGRCAIGTTICDFAYNGPARQRAADAGAATALCYSDATCTAAFGSWSQCGGLSTGYTNGTREGCIGASNCTMRESSVCLFDLACNPSVANSLVTGIGDCRVPSSQQAALLSATPAMGTTVPTQQSNGMCSLKKFCSNATTTVCTTNGDCPGGTCTTPNCGTGYTWANDLCFKNCTVDADCSAKTCSTGADCTAPGETCESGKCVVDGMCDGTKCAGRCSIPSSAFPCNGDEDCRGPYFDPKTLGGSSAPGDPMWFNGTCDTGSSTCRCMGPTHCGAASLESEETCPTAFERFYFSVAPVQTLRWANEMRRMTEAAKSASGVKPTLIFGTLPLPKSGECYPFHQNDGGFRAGNLLLKQNLPLVADCGLRVEQLQTTNQPIGAADNGHSDWIHLDQPGAEACGLGFSALKQTLNTCVKSDGTTQFYCRAPTGAYATCSIDANCDGVAAGDCDGSACICSSSSQCPGGDCVVRNDGSCPASTDTFNAEP